MNSRTLPPKKEVTYLRRKILRWFDENGRSYPWRDTQEPFRILIAEMMLRRTKADQVVSVFKEFFQHFETPKQIKTTEEKVIYDLLKPLGLEWRAENIINVCSVLTDRFDGIVPNRRNELKQLPGVGQYVSGIVCSVAFNQKEWIVDSNVVRVFERFFGLETKNEARRDSLVIDIAKQYIKTTKPREANLGMVDFGGLVCLPSQNPLCEECPLFYKCEYTSKW